jgi:hypothetical protein
MVGKLMKPGTAASVTHGSKYWPVCSNKLGLLARATRTGRDAVDLYRKSLEDWRELRRRSPLDRQGLDEQGAVEAALEILDIKIR